MIRISVVVIANRGYPSWVGIGMHGGTKTKCM